MAKQDKTTVTKCTVGGSNLASSSVDLRAENTHFKRRNPILKVRIIDFQGNGNN
jgi:hypothetical protein